MFSLHKKKVKDAKDELEFATNWRRVFIELYQHMKWLNAYSVINEIAMQKILKKFVKEHFEIKDNVIDKNLTEFIKSRQFFHRKQLHFLIDDLFSFFAHHFTDDNKLKSKKVLEQHNTEMRRKDAMQISFFGGATMVMVIAGCFFLFTKSSDGDEDFGVILSSLSVIRMTFVFVYILYACGFAINVFQSYGVNYLYIFELDPHYKMTHEQFFRTGTILFFIWASCFALSIMEVKLEYLFDGEPRIFIFALMAFFLLYCL